MPTSGGMFERRHSVLRTRRHWSDGEKRAIVAETRLPGANVSAISRRHGAAQSLIYQWRKLFAATVAEPAFLPVAITAAPTQPTPMSMPASLPKPAMIEIELAFGRKLRVALDIDIGELRRIIVALETA